MNRLHQYLTFIFMAGTLCGCGVSSSHDSEDTEDFEYINEGGELNADEEYSETGEESPNTPRITSIPDENRISSDLTGRKISEGYEQGYHSDDWTFTIQAGQVHDLRINQVVVNQPDLYIVETSMKIQPNASFYYNTKLKISYRNSPSEGWIIDNITSQGMDVVSNGAYEDCVRLRIDEDGWGGTKGLYVRNNSDATLVVGGRLLTDDGWQRFSRVVKAHEEGTVGGLFGGGSVKDYRLDFVIKEF